MPRTHGSGLFTRGQTQIVSLLTLGTAKEGQRIDDLSSSGPPVHTTTSALLGQETGRMARRSSATSATGPSPSGLSTNPPSRGPCTIRIVGRRVDGSSSMSSVTARRSPDGRRCADQGAGLGIAMGLVEGDACEILTARGAGILGDMDFKVAGTAEGSPRCRWTSDRGVGGDHGAGLAGEGRRIAILGRMESAISAARGTRRARAATVSTIQIPRVHRHGDRQGRSARVEYSADRHRGRRDDPGHDRGTKVTPPSRRSGT